MTAYSYTDWTSKSADEQKSNPGISIERDHLVNNPDRGVYWSPATAASALSRHIENTLAGEDRLQARRMWNSLRQLNRQATESPRMVDRAMQGRQADAHNALGAYNGDLNHEQLEQLTSVFDDVVHLQVEAQIQGIDPVDASRRMLQRAAARAVGYDVDDRGIEAEMRPLVESDKGSAIIANMNQSVAQLGLLLKDMPLDALDQIGQIGQDTGYTEELQEDHRRLNDILNSIPLVLNPQGVEPETNFSVRMETQEEATVMETIVRWAGQQDRLPEPNEINRAFSSWRDNGLADSPYSVDREPALGIVVGNTTSARDNVGDLIAGLDANAKSREAPIVVLTVEADDSMRAALATSGRAIIDVTAEADSRGVHLSSQGKDLPANRIELVSLTRDQAADPIERSLAVNAVVGRSDGIGYVAGAHMNAVEAQAIHLAGTLRKLTLGMAADGSSMKFDELRELRREARELDSATDPQRYYTAGHARPHMGVNAVAFEAANMYDRANKANAPGRDLIGEAFASIPKATTILTVENPNNALNKWMDVNGNVGKRKVLYAEATRNLSFAEITGAGLDGERKVARESGMDLKIYDKPASEREYGFQEIKSRIDGPDQGVTGQQPEGAGFRRVCLDTPIEWDDPRVRGAVILVSGNASAGAINTQSQAIKVAQEAVMDRAHSALVLTDMTDKRETRDIHSAHMIRLAGEMGKKTTVLDGNGHEMGLAEARARSAGIAENFSEKQERVIGEQMTVGNPSRNDQRQNTPIDVAAKDDLGQLALAALPGMDAARAIQFAHTDVTLREIRTDKSDEMRRQLFKLGMPAETRAIINDIAPWAKAMDRALDNMKAAEAMGAKLHVPTDHTHPVELASGGAAERHAVFTIGGYDYENQPVAAFIGNSDRYREAGVALTLSQAEKAGPGAERGTMVDPAEVVDRVAIRRTIEQMTAKGYGIGVTLEEGVSRAVLEEAAHVPDAKLVVVAPGNIQAASPQLRSSLKTLLEQDRAAVMMPVNIAPNPAPEPRNGEERKPDTYAENRGTMMELLAKTAKVGVVVASSDKDQSLHVVRQMIDLDKPIAAMVPQDMSAAGSDLYSANMRLMRGPGKTGIQSVSLAQATSANAYAEITDQETAVVFENGVRRGNAGTFQSAQLSKAPMARSGHHYREMGWGAAAHPISSVDSIDRFVEKAEQGLGALGKYRQPTERELEARRLEREHRANERGDSLAAQFTREQFGQTSALHRSAIEKEAGRAIEVSTMDDAAYSRREGERAAARQAAAAGQSMG